MNERTSVLVSMLYVSHVGVYREWCCLCVATICSMTECKITFVSVNVHVCSNRYVGKGVYICIHACPTICVKLLSFCLLYAGMCRLSSTTTWLKQLKVD